MWNLIELHAGGYCLHFLLGEEFLIAQSWAVVSQKTYLQVLSCSGIFLEAQESGKIYKE